MRKPQWIKNQEKFSKEVSALDLSGEGICPDCEKPYNSEYHIGKSCFNGPWEVA